MKSILFSAVMGIVLMVVVSYVQQAAADPCSSPSPTKTIVSLFGR